MNEESCAELAATDAALLELGVVLGENHAFSLVAGRCSAAVADGLRRLREQKLYKRCMEKWDDFCPKYLKISRVEADRTIKLLQEFGPAYFELSQLTRVSPETYRAIAPQIQSGVLHHNGEAIELTPENSRRVAAAINDMRSAMPKRTSAMDELTRDMKDVFHECDVQQRLEKLGKCFFTIVAEFERISRDAHLGEARSYFQNTLANLRDEMVRVAEEHGL